MQAYATLLEPAAQIGILEQTTIAGDDDVSRARVGGGDHWDIASIVHLQVDVDVGKERCQEDEGIRDVPLGDPVALQPRPAEDLNDLLGESPRGDRLRDRRPRRSSTLPGTLAGLMRPET